MTLPLITDEKIVKHKRVALMELVMKHIRARDMLEFSQEIVELLSQYIIPPELFKGLMYYIVERGNTSDATQFLHQIAEKADDYREVVMTIAEQLRREGEKQASLKIARQLLEKGVELDIVKLSTGLTDTELKNLFKD